VIALRTSGSASLSSRGSRVKLDVLAEDLEADLLVQLVGDVARDAQPAGDHFGGIIAPS
jgi:hypothetical protein